MTKPQADTARAEQIEAELSCEFYGGHSFRPSYHDGKVCIWCDAALLPVGPSP